MPSRYSQRVRCQVQQAALWLAPRLVPVAMLAPGSVPQKGPTPNFSEGSSHTLVCTS